MSVRNRIGVAVVWVVSLVLAGAWGHAQAPARQPLVPLLTPIVISGSDLGFRVEGRRGNAPVGTFVVRSNASAPWVEPELWDQT